MRRCFFFFQTRQHAVDDGLCVDARQRKHRAGALRLGCFRLIEDRETGFVNSELRDRPISRVRDAFVCIPEERGNLRRERGEIPMHGADDRFEFHLRLSARQSGGKGIGRRIFPAVGERA